MLQETKHGHGDVSKISLSRRRFLTGTAKWVGASVLLSPLLNTSAYARFMPHAKSVVETAAGKVRGGVSDGVHIFRGIQYGGSTAGKNRFMPPTPPGEWSGVHDTLEYGDSCPQVPYDLVKPASISWFTPFYSTNQSEDCLRLNVWTPALNDGGKRPVLVWLHGGGYSRGSGASSSYDGINMVRRGDVVTVTVNHRLNAFGYTHLGDLAGERFESSGNVGMLDIVQALEWVRDNIENFGGDPGNVMIFGESGGGAKVSTVLAMTPAKGLFHRAVVQSGAALRVETRENATKAASYLLEELGLKASEIYKLQTVPAQQLVSAQAAASVKAAREGRIRAFRPVLGEHIPEHPFDPVGSNLSLNVPVMVGTNKHEQALFSVADTELYDLDEEGMKRRVGQLMGSNADAAIAAYRKAFPEETPSGIYFTMASDQRFRVNSIRLAERKHAQDGANVYMYRFDWEAPAWEGRFRAAHAFEIPFVFDNAQLNSDITGGTPEAVALASKMSAAWIAFARSGNPNHRELPNWPSYTPTTRATMIFNDECEIAYDPGKEARLFWERLDNRG